MSYRVGRSPYTNEPISEPGERDVPVQNEVARLHAQEWPDPRGAFWAAIPDQPLCPLDQYGQATAVFSPGVQTLLTSGAYVWQELAPGMAMRIWLEGDVDAPRIRVGSLTAWDTPAPFAALDRGARTLFPTLGTPHAVPHAQSLRLQMALSWLAGWRETIFNAAPHLPLIIQGTMAEGGFSSARTKRVHDNFAPRSDSVGIVANQERRFPGDDINTRFLIEDAFQVSKLTPLGWDDLLSTRLPRIPTQPWTVGAPSDAFALLTTATATHNLLAPVPLLGVRLRPTDATNRSRFVLTRAQLPIATAVR